MCKKVLKKILTILTRMQIYLTNIPLPRKHFILTYGHTSQAPSTAGTGQSACCFGSLQTDPHSGTHVRPWSATHTNDKGLH